MHQVEHTLLARSGEILLHIEFTDGLSHNAAHQTHGTLPTGRVLQGTAHHTAQLEGLSTESIAQLTAGTGDDLDLGIGLQIIEGRLCQHLLHLMDSFRLTYVNEVECRESAQQEHISPIDARIIHHQLRVGYLVVVRIDITQLHSALTGLGDTRLNGHHGFHLLLGHSLIIAYELIEVGQIGLVSLTDTDGLLVIVQIIVLRTQSESALTNTYKVHRGITHVRAYAHAKHQRILTLAVELGTDQLILVTILDGSDGLKGGLQRCPTLTVQAHAVHHQLVERADLLTQCTLLLRCVGILQDQFLDMLLVLLIQVHKCTVVGMLRIQGMCFHPSSGCILIEIFTWTHRGVEVLLEILPHDCCGQHQAGCD